MTSKIKEKPVVLVIEDEQYIHDLYCKRLCKKVQLLQAHSIASAKNFFERHLNNKISISMVVVDGSIGPSYAVGTNPVLPNTIPFIKKIRILGFAGQIVASTGVDGWEQIMIEAGCNIRVEKDAVPAFVLEHFLL